jgi:hypothetical protein
MKLAKLAHVKPLVSIDRSRRSGRHGVTPTSAQLVSALKGWRQRWPGQISDVSAWNEPNINGKKPKTVAKWWLALRKACSACTVLPGELVDQPNATKWATDFIKAAKRKPAIWALHAYVDANTLSTKRTKAFLKAVTGKVWLTETGGVVSRANGSVRFKGYGVDFQAKATSFLLNTLTKVSPRLQRLYVYEWSTPPSELSSWDSGLVGPDGKGRPSLNVLRKYLGMGPIDLTAPGTKPPTQ